VDVAAYLLRIDVKEMALGNDYRRRKKDARRKAARIIIAEERGYGIALEDLGKRPNERMIRGIPSTASSATQSLYL
jgi:hypothetical protein